MRFFLFLFVAISSAGNITAQSVRDLQKKKSGILNELAVTQSLISKSEKDKAVSLNQLLLLRSQVQSRKNLIENLGQEIVALNIEIVEGEARLTMLSSQLNDLKVAYANLIVAAFKSRYNQQKLLFIFSSSNFNQAYQRIRYFREFSALIKKKGSDILVASQEISNAINAVKVKREILNKAIAARNREVVTLSQTERDVNSMVLQLQKKTIELKVEQKRLTEQSLLIEKEIGKLLEEERKKSAVNGKIIYNASAVKVSSKFEDNRGKFLMPLEHGIVVEGFGEHNHPVLAHVKVKSNGVRIVSSTGSTVFSIFNGQITRVITIAGLNKIVIVRHGKFLTVYSNLTQVFVKVGDLLSAGQSIGSVKEGGFLQFEIWNENQPLNPEVWLRKY